MAPWGSAPWSTRPSTRRCCRSTGSRWRRCSGSASRCWSARWARASSPAASDRVAVLAGGSRQIAAGNLETRIDRRRARRAGRPRHRVQPDGRGARRRRARRSCSRRTRSSPGTRPSRSGSRKRPASCARRRICFCARGRCRRWASSAPGWRTRSTTRSPARWGSSSSSHRLARTVTPPCRSLQDLEREALRIRKIVQNLLRLAQQQSGHDTTAVDLARIAGRRDRAVRSHGAGSCGDHSRAPLRGHAPGARQRHADAGGVHSIDPERALGHAPRWHADARDSRRRRQAGARLHLRHRQRHQPRTPAPDLRSLLHHQDRRPRRRRAGAVVRAHVVEDNGGTILAESAVGVGTKFVLTFPADAGRTHRA